MSFHIALTISTIIFIISKEKIKNPYYTALPAIDCRDFIVVQFKSTLNNFSFLLNKQKLQMGAEKVCNSQQRKRRTIEFNLRTSIYCKKRLVTNMVQDELRNTGRAFLTKKNDFFGLCTCLTFRST